MLPHLTVLQKMNARFTEINKINKYVQLPGTRCNYKSYVCWAYITPACMSQVRPDLWHVQLDLMFQLFNPFHPFFSFKGYETRQLSQILLKQTEKATKNMIDVSGIAENLPSFYDFFPISEPILSRLIEICEPRASGRVGPAAQ